MGLAGSGVTRALGRIACGASAIVVVACSTDPFAPADPVDAGDDATASGIDASGSDASASADGNTADTHVDEPGDASADAADTAPPCLPPKLPNTSTCTTSSECCSNACASNNTCTAACKSATMPCAIGSADCCIGTYCSTSTLGHCALCHPFGAAAEMGPFGTLAASCCSGRVDATGKCAL